MNKSEGIQTLRGIAIILIVLSHFNAVFGFFPWASSFGAVGVDIFIVISGFLSYRTAKTFRIVSIKENIYMTKCKIHKFYSTHIMVEFFMLILFIAEQYVEGFQTFEVLAVIVGGIMSLFLIQSFVPIRRIYYALNGVSWFLSDLVLFYFLTPYINYYLDSYRSKPKRRIVAIIVTIYILQLALISGVSFYVGGNYKVMHALFYVSPFFRSFEFAIGSCCGALYEKIKEGIQSRKYILTSLVCLSLIGLIVVCFSINKVKAEYGFIFAIPIACILVMSFTLGNITGITNNQILIGIGDISFEIFITHFAILSYLKFINMNFLHFGIQILVPVAVIYILVMAWIVAKVRSARSKWK